jgi:hypothetical protein
LEAVNISQITAIHSCSGGDWRMEPLKKAADCKNKVQLLVAKIKPALERIRDNKGHSVAYFHTATWGE